jgi:chromosome segregation protein
MMQLTSVKLVQFFLYEKLDVRVEEVTGIFGPNGSGKSALLDAVQIAMLGARSGRHLALNAQADDKMSSSRSIRSYCLGQFGDSEEDIVRQRATTYITLVWTNTVTKELLSMGVCVYAGIEKEGHEVIGRYLVRGVDLALGDHLELIDGAEKPREWSAFRAQLHQRAIYPDDDIVFNDGDRFVRALLIALRGEGTLPAQQDAFERSFRFALRMRFDKPLDDIIRNQVLEARPTNVKKFREVTDSFRQLAVLVAEVQKRIAQGEAIQKIFDKAAEESRRQVTWQALACDAKREQAVVAFDEATRQEQDATNAHTDACDEQRKIDAGKIEADREVERLRTLRQQHPAHTRHGALQKQAQTERTTAAEQGQQLVRTFSALKGMLGDAHASGEISDGGLQILRQVEHLRSVADVLALDRQGLIATVRPALRAIDDAISELFNVRQASSADIKVRETDLEVAQADLERCRQGRAPLSREVQDLIRELKASGLHPTPVCDLVTIEEVAWQPMIESYLGPNREALLVPEPEERQAFKVYRGLSGARLVVGAKIVMESRYLNRHSPVPGSVAELIGGGNRAAVNYLRSKFGDAKRATTDDECLASRHAMTADGMLVADGEIDRKRLTPAGQFRIGAGTSTQTDELERDVRRLTQVLRDLRTRDEKLKALWNRLQVFARTDETLGRFLALFDARQGATEAFASLTRQLGEQADAEYVRLGEDESAASEKATKAFDDAVAVAGKVGGLQEKMVTAQRALAATRAAVADAELLADTARSAEDFDRDFAQRNWDDLLEEFAADYFAMSEKCEASASGCRDRCQNRVNAAQRDLGEFIREHHEHLPASAAEHWRAAAAWLADLLKRLNDTDLRTYKERMDEALKTSQITFRNDVALALHANLRWLAATIDSLNKVLANSPTFSNGERYRFQLKKRPMYQELFRFVESVAAGGPLFNEDGSEETIPEQFIALMEGKIGAGVNERTPLDDYREFYEFDIEILRQQPDAPVPKVIGHLSKRLGSGSGGEHRAPLYVIAGAALASAYRLDPKKPEGGIRLMLLDEAFNKMDMSNIAATMQYLQDLGLQLFMASPGENLGALTAFLHRYYDLMRDPVNNLLRMQGHDVSEATRELFRSDMVEFHPELVENEMGALASATMAGAEVGSHA